MFSKARIGAALPIFLLAWAASFTLPRSAQAETCAETILRLTGECLQGDIRRARECRARAEQTAKCGGSGASSSALGAGCSEVSANIDWIFRDGGARSVYDSQRRQGKSALEAAIAAQGHNRKVQDLLRSCQSVAEAYLAQLGASPGGATLANRIIGTGDCKCISVVPIGRTNDGRTQYRVTNACDGLDINVRFVDQVHRFAEHSANAAVGLLDVGQARIILAPATFFLPSLAGYSIRGARNSYACNCNAMPCQ